MALNNSAQHSRDLSRKIKSETERMLTCRSLTACTQLDWAHPVPRCAERAFAILQNPPLVDEFAETVVL